MTMAIDHNSAAFKTAGSNSELKAARRHVFKVKLEVVQKDNPSIDITAVIHRVICGMIDTDKSIVLFDMQGAPIDASKFSYTKEAFDAKFGVTMQGGSTSVGGFRG